MCRQHIIDKTEIGKQIDFAIKSGKLISDSLIVSMVEEWLRRQYSEANAFIFDGFPRTVNQAKSLDDFLIKEEFSDFNLTIVNMILPDEVAIDRLTKRLICQNKDCQVVYSITSTYCSECYAPLVRRADDEVEVTRERLLTYRRHASDLLDYYRQSKHTFLEIIVEQPLEQVFMEFTGVVDSKRRGISRS